jgi:hypothetical protein
MRGDANALTTATFAAPEGPHIWGTGQGAQLILTNLPRPSQTALTPVRFLTAQSLRTTHKNDLAEVQWCTLRDKTVQKRLH